LAGRVVPCLAPGGLPKRARQRETLAGPSETTTGAQAKTNGNDESPPSNPRHTATEQSKPFKNKGKSQEIGASTEQRNKKTRNSKPKPGPRDVEPRTEAAAQTEQKTSETNGKPQQRSPTNKPTKT